MQLKSHNLNIGASIQHFDVDGSLIREYYYPTSNRGPEPFIEAKVENENGEIISNEKYPFRSFNLAVLAMQKYLTYTVSLYRSEGGMNLYETKNISGSIISWGGQPGYYTEGTTWGAGYGQTNIGICVGTSSVTNSMDMFNLYGKIEHGNGTNQLGYQDSIEYAPTLISSSYYLTISRSFINSGSSDVNIREIGVIANEQTKINQAAYAYLLCRDTKDYAGNDININLPTASILTVNVNFIFPNTNHLVIGYIRVWESFAKNGLVTSKNVSGSNVNISSYNRKSDANIIYVNSINENTGITIGTSSATFSLDDYNLYGELPSFNVTYFPHIVSSYISGSQSGSYYIERLITNYSTTSYAVEEMGIRSYSTNAASRFLWARTLTGTINLQPSQSLNIKYYYNVVASGS